MRILLVLFFFIMVTPHLYAQMDNQKMGEIIKENAFEIEGEPGAWQLIYQERILLILTDETNNRMRIFTPVVDEENIDEEEMRKMLMANFHSALDAKYSLYNGFVISTFTHPLQELTATQFIDAMDQVVRLADTFGSTYSSTELIFGGEAEEAPESEEDKRINQSPRTNKKS